MRYMDLYGRNSFMGLILRHASVIVIQVSKLRHEGTIVCIKSETKVTLAPMFLRTLRLSPPQVLADPFRKSSA